MNLPDSKTLECLREAITGESNAVAKYMKFSKIAKEEGHESIAYLFKALVVAEQVHIKNHNNVLKDDSFEPKIENHDAETTLENVKDAIGGETHEFKSMYPDMIKVSKQQKTFENKVATLSFEWARAVEKTHAEVLTEVIHKLEAGEKWEVEELYVCRVCGNLVLGEPSKDYFCPVCKHDRNFYKKVKKLEDEK